MDTTKYLTPLQLSRQTNLPESWLRREASAGRIPCIRASGRMFFDLEAVRSALRVVSLADMLAGLRGPRMPERVNWALLLARSIGAGLALQRVDELEVEHTVGRDLSILLARAAATGDGEAIDQLERILTNNPAQAATTPREGTAAQRAAGA
ncbi:MAG: hypothetical protein KF699_00580 [Phycisphaeraceae bacterium]|nr:hypothetical protein [Phycisphaeraceae bacterium]